MIQKPYWTDLRSVGNTGAAQAVILIPLVGYWIIFNEQIADYANLSKALIPRDTASAARDPPWRFFATYFGLCFVAVASVIYQWRCPSEVKLYPTASEYVGRISPEISNIERVRVQQALENGDKESKGGLDDARDSLNRAREAMASERAPDDFKRDVLQLHFDYCNRRYAKARLAVAACYAVGFLILAGLSIDVFWRVAHALYHSISKAFFGT